MSDIKRRHFKEKILSHYEQIANRDEESLLKESFWDEMFLLNVKYDMLTEMVMKDVNIHVLVRRCCQYLENDSELRGEHALEVRNQIHS
jgi:hypothetical protein